MFPRSTSLSIGQILQWADAHHRRTGKWPDLTSGNVFEAPQEKWLNIDCNLRRGGRDLPGGWSLAQMLDAMRGKRNIADLPPHTIEQILSWADLLHARTGKWPTCASGPIVDAPGENWCLVNGALHLGFRGLAGGSSLLQLLEKHRGVPRKSGRSIKAQTPAGAKHNGSPREAEARQMAMRAQIELRRRGRNVQDLPPFSLDQILVWADAYHKRHRKWPNRRSGLIDGTAGETWGAVCIAMQRGLRGLTAGLSLARLLAEQRGAYPGRFLRLSQEQILSWADAHHDRTGEWPMVESGAVAEAPQITWARINNALQDGLHGLTGGSSLARLLDERRGTRKSRMPTPLNLKTILAWADAHYARHGKWPSVHSGVVAESPSDTWNAVNLALEHGLRTLRGGSSLARLLAQRRGKRNRAALPALSEEQILAWADAHHARHGKWPTQTSGPVEGAPGETWGAIDSSLVDGRRGLPGGESLRVLLDRCRRCKGDFAAAALPRRAMS